MVKEKAHAKNASHFQSKIKANRKYSVDYGKKHDLAIARKYVKELIIYPCIMADLTYNGFHQIKSKLFISRKKPKNFSLPKIAKQINRKISWRRIVIEHIDCQLKHFRILTKRYRNRWKCFGFKEEFNYWNG